MKRIEELTAKEKYEILLLADENSDQNWLCDKIDDVLGELYIIARYSEIQRHFNMRLIKPDVNVTVWWPLGDPAREVAWKKLIEYWKHEAEKES